MTGSGSVYLFRFAVAASAWAFGATMSAHATPSRTTTIAGDDSQGRLVDDVVAQVGTAVITRSDVILEARLAKLRHAGSRAALDDALSDGLFRSVLRQIVIRELFLGEVRRLQLRPVSEADVQIALGAVRDRLATSENVQRFFRDVGLLEGHETALSPSPSVLTALLRAELEVQRFVALRVWQGLEAEEADVVRCFDENRRFFGASSLREVRPLIEHALREDASDVAMRGLLLKLAKRTPIRFSPGFELDLERETELSLSTGTRTFRCRATKR